MCSGSSSCGAERMRRAPLVRVVAAVCLAGWLGACATVTGTAVGAGIGAIGGDVALGAAAGGATGLAIDIFGN